MLVLSRQRDQSIMIGDNIEITVVDVRGDKVRLGINAPNTIPVHRKEVFQAIQREKSGGKIASSPTTASMAEASSQALPPPSKGPGPERTSIDAVTPLTNTNPPAAQAG